MFLRMNLGFVQKWHIQRYNWSKLTKIYHPRSIAPVAHCSVRANFVLSLPYQFRTIWPVPWAYYLPPHSLTLLTFRGRSSTVLHWLPYRNLWTTSGVSLSVDRPWSADWNIDSDTNRSTAIQCFWCLAAAEIFSSCTNRSRMPFRRYRLT